MLLIRNATVYTPVHVIEHGAVLVDGGRIAAAGLAADLREPAGTEVLEADGLILAPGFIDLQFNGGFGHDFTHDQGAIWDVAARLPRYGVTAFLPTIISSPLNTVAEGQRVVTAGRPMGFRGAEPLGLHVEGPFLNPQKTGAHNPVHLRPPSLDAIAGWSPATGVRMVTMAPELPGALEVVAALAARGVIVSAGHTMATFDQAVAGFDAGVRYGTHLFNAMPSLHHRDPGLAGALLTDGRVAVGVIPDGIHTHPSIVDLAWRALGPSRMNVVTDAMAALGMPPGRHRLGDFEVSVDATSAHLADGTLAGSILSMDQALRNLMAFTGCALEEALPTLTTIAAGVLGLHADRGRIAPGAVADFVLLTPDFRVRRTIIGGEIVYEAVPCSDCEAGEV